MNKKGQLNLDVVRGVFVSVLILAVIGLSVMLAIDSLDDANIFDAGSIQQNQSGAINANISNAISTFFGNTGTIMSILVVVVIISAIALVILVVSRFGSGASQ